MGIHSVQGLASIYILCKFLAMIHVITLLFFEPCIVSQMCLLKNPLALICLVYCVLTFAYLFGSPSCLFHVALLYLYLKKAFKNVLAEGTVLKDTGNCLFTVIMLYWCHVGMGAKWYG